MDKDQVQRPDTRRTALKKMGGVGIGLAGAAWITPSVLSFDKAFAVGSCCSSAPPVEFFPTCQGNMTVTAGCKTTNTATFTVCRTSTTQTMLLARDSAGTQSPFFDELGVVTVVGAATVVRNYISYQNDCRDPAGTDFPLSTTIPPCGTTTAPAIDITPMFGAECGTFTVTLSVRNGSTPTSWSTAWVVPV